MWEVIVFASDVSDDFVYDAGKLLLFTVIIFTSQNDYICIGHIPLLLSLH